jgi:tetratricopeptide (TPR) repeat protein
MMPEMKKKYFCLILIAILALTPLSITSVKVMATNVSSYQYGYQEGKSGYQCSNFDADCDNGLNTCDIDTYSLHSTPQLTNKTSCLEGFVDGWKQWCNADLSLCAKFFLSNVFPGALADNESSVDICLKNASDNVDNNDSSNILSPLSKHCDGSIGEVNSPTWKVFEDKSTNWPVIHTSFENVTKQTNAALQKQNSLNGTWNFVNDTGDEGLGPMANESKGTGTITFNNGRFVQNDQQQGSYSVDWVTQRLNLDYFKGGNPWFNVYLTFENLGQNHIELSDYHYDTIHLMRDNTNPVVKTLVPALQSFDKALKIKPSYAYALELKGIMLYKTGHFKEAVASLDKALALEPYSYAYSTLENKGLALYQLGDYTDALSALDKALRLNSWDEHAFFNKGLVLATLGLQTHDIGDLNAALDNLNKALRTNPNYADALSIKTLITQLLMPPQTDK